MQFKKYDISSSYSPSGDQPRAIEKLVKGIQQNKSEQVLLGVTGSGKTFTMANIIAKTGKPALIMAHNKTLAAQLYSEMKEFFPNNAVEYFVSYYDYYQPEAYIAKTDTYIEKDSSINDQIDRMRHSATRSVLEQNNVIVISSVSCIYGLGSPELYIEMTHEIKKGDDLPIPQISRKLVELQYQRNDINFTRGSFRIKGDILDIFPCHLEDTAWRISLFGDEVENIYSFDPLTGERFDNLDKIKIYANSHHITPRPTLIKAIEKIKNELKDRLEFFEKNNMLLEAQRIKERTNYDIEMILESGSCKGIENYSRYLSGRNKGEPPPTLFEYFPKDSLLFIDESHVTIPQIGGMYNGDRARKENLVSHGFRLPSALDNRPLKFDEWNAMRPQTIYVSATPGKYELEKTSGEIVEQIIRPTGLIDPKCIIKPITEDKEKNILGQIDDLMNECRLCTEKGRRVLVTTLTKKMAEHLSEYMEENGVKVKYLHSDINTIERIEIINSLRKGDFDVLIGINLLREGLDIPECGLVAILDADKAGFLRSETSLIQTIGRAARNSNSKVVLYADIETKAIKTAITETERRRDIQIKYNKENNITPRTIIKSIREDLKTNEIAEKESKYSENDVKKIRKEMLEAAANLDFEKAAELRDIIKKVEERILFN